MKFRKRPVVIEAVQWTGTVDGIAVVAAHMPGPLIVEGATGIMEIQTLEGVMLASPGDWIIKGVVGEFYPCKPDVFEIVYEPVFLT